METPEAQTTASKPRSRWTQDYTIDKPAKNLNDVEDDGPHIVRCMVKWLVAAILACVVLFCLTSSKLSLLVLGQIYRDVMDKENTLLSVSNSTNSTSSISKSASGKREAIFLMLVFILVLPQAVSFLYASWNSLSRKSHPWPTRRAILWILIGGALEVACLSYLCLCAMTVYALPSDMFMLLMSALFIVPTIWQTVKIRKYIDTNHGKIRMAVFAVSAILQVEGLIVLASKINRLDAQIGIPIAFILLSAAWSPKIRKLQTQPVRRFHRSRDEITDITTRTQLPNAETISPSLIAKRKKARGKAAVIMSLWKMILTPFICALICHACKIADLRRLSLGFGTIGTMRPALDFFLLQIFTSFLGYHLAWLACSMCMQQVAFALPLTLCTPLVILLHAVKGACGTSMIPLRCSFTQENFSLIIAVGLSMWIGQFLSTGYYVWKNQGFVMAKASFLFWIPSYNGAMLEQNLLLNRRNQVTDDDHVTQQILKQDTYVFICTTMYHEEDYEMEQLLHSLHDIDKASKTAGRHIESHVFFDGCIKSEELNSYILQLVALVETTLKVQLSKCVKMKTPYGMQLRWTLPGGMPFTVHLKDNNKVKNKKRWSQVMYMSYILDFKEKLHNIRDDQTFILTTDADVNFKHESMEALIDYMLQDEKIGAVCGRTHPMGKGPLVWYQIFDYAIGHWFQKVANHMLGSVLCCPGCFSLYRCKAVRDILPMYSTNVNEAFEFLTKDMGEDRWMCTLMVQAGWRLMYCAAAEDMTYCPMNFDEFYKQRRRWMPSTLANLSLLISEWRVVTKSNEYVSILFVVFQLFLLMATIIGPSTVILVITGGMNYVGLGTNEVTTVTVLSLITLGYGLICLTTSQSFQLNVAKLLTFAFAIVMIMVTIGVAEQIARELAERKALRMPPTGMPNVTVAPLSLEKSLPAGISTLYLAGLAGIFVLAALFHPSEAFCLINGIWYLLCLPSGYLVLTIYSVANMTDRSWGTREGKTVAAKVEGEAWYTPIIRIFTKFCPCMSSCKSPFSRKDTKKKANAKNVTDNKKKNPHSADGGTDSSSSAESDSSSGLSEEEIDLGLGRRTSHHRRGRGRSRARSQQPLRRSRAETLDWDQYAADPRVRQLRYEERQLSPYYPGPLSRRSVRPDTHGIRQLPGYPYDYGYPGMRSADELPYMESGRLRSMSDVLNQPQQESLHFRALYSGYSRDVYGRTGVTPPRGGLSALKEGVNYGYVPDYGEVPNASRMSSRRSDRFDAQPVYSNCPECLKVAQGRRASQGDMDERCGVHGRVLLPNERYGPRVGLPSSHGTPSRPSITEYNDRMIYSNPRQRFVSEEEAYVGNRPPSYSFDGGKALRRPEEMSASDSEYSQSRSLPTNSSPMYLSDGYDGSPVQSPANTRRMKSKQLAVNTKEQVSRQMSGGLMVTHGSRDVSPSHSEGSIPGMLEEEQEEGGTLMRESVVSVTMIDSAIQDEGKGETSNQYDKQTGRTSSNGSRTKNIDKGTEDGKARKASEERSQSRNVKPMDRNTQIRNSGSEDVNNGSPNASGNHSKDDGYKEENQSRLSGNTAEDSGTHSPVSQSSGSPEYGVEETGGERSVEHSEEPCTSEENPTGRLSPANSDRSAPDGTSVDDLDSEEPLLQREHTQSTIIDSQSGTSLPEVTTSTSGSLASHSIGSIRDEVKFDPKMPIDKWLKGDLEIYIENFRKHGYDNLEFVTLMNDKDLGTIGVQLRGHKQRLSRTIKKLPKIEREEGIPDNVQEWLEDLGLGEYWQYFEENSYTEPSDLEDLKSMGRDLVQETFKVEKMAHIAMMWQAIRKLQYPNTGQIKIRQARRELARLPLHRMEVDNGDDGREFDFWEGLRQMVLVPEAAAFGQSVELKEKLAGLRNSTLVIFFVANVLWMLLIMVLVRHQKLKILGVDAIGLGFLVVYGSIILLQFFTMVCHRFGTMVHLLARAPWTCSSSNSQAPNKVRPGRSRRRGERRSRHLTIERPSPAAETQA